MVQPHKAVQSAPKGEQLVGGKRSQVADDIVGEDQEAAEPLPKQGIPAGQVPQLFGRDGKCSNGGTELPASHFR